MSKLTRSGQQGFSLVEILVVIAIIAVLGAIAGFALGGAQRAAKRTACLNNMEQIGRALHLYAADFDTYVPPVLTSEVTDVSGEHKVKGEPERWRDCLMKYTRSGDVFYCPFDKDARTPTPDASVERTNSLFTSYQTTPIMSGATFGPNDSIQLSVDADRRPSYAQDRILTTRNMQNGDLIFSSFHGELMTVLFLDGHAKSIKITP